MVLIVRNCAAVAYDPLDPTGNITIKWDLISWTADGYVAVVTMNNFQMYRHIMSPGWTLSWTWAKKEVIWSMVGAQATEQGDCSKFKGGSPHCCKRTPTILDLLPGVPYNQQIANCCKGGVVASYGQDPAAAVSSFQVSVGLSGTSNKTVKLPQNFTLLGPGLGYTCGPAKVVPSTTFFTPDRRRKTQALSKFYVLVYRDLKFPLNSMLVSSFLVSICSDLERDVHLLAVPGLQASQLLRLLLILLQRHHRPLLLLRLRLRDQGLHQVFIRSHKLHHVLTLSFLLP